MGYFLFYVKVRGTSLVKPIRLPLNLETILRTRKFLRHAMVAGYTHERGGGTFEWRNRPDNKGALARTHCDRRTKDAFIETLLDSDGKQEGPIPFPCFKRWTLGVGRDRQLANKTLQSKIGGRLRIESSA